MRRLFPLLLAVVACSTILVSTTHPAVAQTPGAGSSLQWNGCGGGFQCSTLNVPLDYSNTSGDSVKLALQRLPATDQSKKIGSLLVNPGGPGGSAIDFLRLWAQVVSPQIRQNFDLVAFDPRGVGHSQGIVCHDTLQQLVAITPNPQTTADWTAAEDASKTFVDACSKKYGGFLNFMGTKNVARDMESVRKALGDDKLTYVGYSYGTAIGEVYADMYPQNIRAMVLDGALDLSQSFQQVNQQQMVGFERAYEAYLANCKQQNCALVSRGDPGAVIDKLMTQVENKPLPAPQADRDAGPGELETAIASALYSQQSWPDLTTALVEALDGDGTGLVALTDQYLERNSDGSYPDLIEANMAVNYVDESCPKDAAAYQQMAKDFAKVAPFFGPSAAVSGLTCLYWPAKPDPLTAPKATGAPPILIVDTTNDPATPYEWGLAVSKQISSAVLLTHRGNGHTIYAQGDTCIDNAVNTYLINLKPPAKGTSCGNGPPPPGEAGGAAGSPSPGSSATAPTQAGSATPAPSMTSSPETPTILSPNTGTGSSGAGTTAVIIIVVFVVVALLAAGGVAFWQWRQVG